MKKIKVALCDGHGMQTGGKRTPVFPDGTKSTETGKNFMHENEFNRAVVKYLKTLLEGKGIQVIEVAPTDADTPLEERVRIANKSKVDLYVSVHANANTSKWGTWGGIETFVYPNGFSKKVGQLIQSKLIKATKLRDRGVKDGKWLYVIKHTTMPSVLVECGFMDNLDEAKLLLSDKYRRLCAKAIAEGIYEAFDIKYEQSNGNVAEPNEKPSTSQNETFYRVITGSYTQRKNADVEMLTLKGYNPFITTKVVDGTLFYRVVALSTKSKANADKIATELRQKGKSPFIEKFIK